MNAWPETDKGKMGVGQKNQKEEEEQGNTNPAAFNIVLIDWSGRLPNREAGICLSKCLPAGRVMLMNNT